MSGLNITPSNLGKNKGKFFLHDPAVYVKIHGLTDTSFYPFGYLEMEKQFAQKLEYAIFKTGIPGQLVRKDLIDQEFTLEGKLKQLQAETVALLSQRYLDSSITGKKRVIMGSDIPAPVFVAVDLVTQTVDGREVRIKIRNGQITAEEFALALGSKEHASIPFKVEALIDEDPMGSNPEWDYLGKASITGTLTSASASITGVVFGELDNLVVGGHIIGENIPDGTTIVAVDYDGDMITMSAAATDDGAAQSIDVEIDHELKNQDNVAFFEFEEAA